MPWMQGYTPTPAWFQMMMAAQSPEWSGDWSKGHKSGKGSSLKGGKKGGKTAPGGKGKDKSKGKGKKGKGGANALPMTASAASAPASAPAASAVFPGETDELLLVAVPPTGLAPLTRTPPSPSQDGSCSARSVKKKLTQSQRCQTPPLRLTTYR